MADRSIEQDLEDAERDFRAVRNGITSAIASEKKKSLKVLAILGVDDDRPYEKQIQAFAAAKTCLEYHIAHSVMAKIAGVSEATIFNYVAKLAQCKDDTPLLSFLPKNGRPCKYSQDVDAAFILYLKDPERVPSEMMKEQLMAVYKRISTSLGITVPAASEEALWKHIERVYQKHQFEMQKPKLVEAKRCVISKTLIIWYADKFIAAVLLSANPKLIFNGDETQVSVKGGYGRVLSMKGVRTSLAVDDRCFSHVSLFPIVSATGRMIDPVPVLHGPPDTFVHDEVCFDGLRLMRTKKGYMDKATFHQIMVEVFIPYVKKVRQELVEAGAARPNEHAVLIVDGHKSRYHAPTFIVLQEAGIFLIILPAHSSHITQPLDLRLNHFIKSTFRNQYSMSKTRNWTPFYVLCPDQATLEQLEGVKKKARKTLPAAGPEEQVLFPTQIADFNFEVPKPRIVSEAEYRRFQFLTCLRTAVRSLSDVAISAAWEQSHLYPFKPVPPTSPETQENLERQIRVSGIVQRRERKTCEVVPLTGVVNSAKDQTLLQHLLRKEKIKPLPVKKVITYETMAKTRKTVTATQTDRDADVGDRALVVRNGKTVTLSAESDADVVISDSDA